MLPCRALRHRVVAGVNRLFGVVGPRSGRGAILRNRVWHDDVHRQRQRRAPGMTTVTVQSAGNGTDTFTGTANTDLLFGQNGDDRLSGQAGNDLLCGGRGNDRLTGSTGADRFSGGSGNDTATDLTPSQGDIQDGTIP
jgi:RTX calcium-binding nonapeptide repeat (4 copies)